MTSYRYLGYGTTDSNGVAHLSKNPSGQNINGYTGIGAGEVDIVASLDNPITDDSIISETLSIFDCIAYDDMETEHISKYKMYNTANISYSSEWSVNSNKSIKWNYNNTGDANSKYWGWSFATNPSSNQYNIDLIKGRKIKLEMDIKSNVDFNDVTNNGFYIQVFAKTITQTSWFALNNPIRVKTSITNYSDIIEIPINCTGLWVRVNANANCPSGVLYTDNWKIEDYGYEDKISINGSYPIMQSNEINTIYGGLFVGKTLQKNVTLDVYQNGNKIGTANTGSTGVATYPYDGNGVGDVDFQFKYNNIASETYYVTDYLAYDDMETENISKYKISSDANISYSTGWSISGKSIKWDYDNTGSSTTKFWGWQFSEHPSTINQQSICAVRGKTVKLEMDVNSDVDFSEATNSGFYVQVFYKTPTITTWTALNNPIRIKTDTTNYSDVFEIPWDCTNLWVRVNANANCLSGTLYADNWKMSVESYNDGISIDSANYTILNSESTTIKGSLLSNGAMQTNTTLDVYKNGSKVGTANTGSTGVAKYTYTGTGAGETEFYFKYGSIVSKTYSIFDCLCYDIGVTGAKSSDWTASSGISVSTDDTGTLLSASTNQTYTSSKLLTGDFEATFQATHEGSVRIGFNKASDSTVQTKIITPATDGTYYYKINRIGSTWRFQYSNNGTTWTDRNITVNNITDEDCYFLFSIEVSGSTRNIKYKDLRIYSI